MRQFRNPLGILLILLGGGMLLTACSTAIPSIPVTALAPIYPAEPWARVIMGIVGVILLVAGFSLVKVLLQIIGFFGGGAVGFYLAAYFMPGIDWIAIVGFIIGAILGVGIAMTATSIGIFIIGALIGAGLVQQIWPYIGGHSAPWLGILLIALASGILTLWLFNFWIAALTAIIGAVLLGMALNLQPLYWIALGIGGIVIQTVISKRAPPPPRPAR